MLRQPIALRLVKQVKGGRLVSQGVFLVSVLSVGEGPPEADEPMGDDGLGVGVACSAQNVPNAAPCGEIPEPPQQGGPAPLLSPTPCSLYSPSGTRAHFQPKGQG